MAHSLGIIYQLQYSFVIIWAWRLLTPHTNILNNNLTYNDTVLRQPYVLTARYRSLDYTRL